MSKTVWSYMLIGHKCLCYKGNLLLLTILLSISLTNTVNAQTLAFPEASGFGKNASGGRGGSVYKVTNLNDSGPGSLRAAVQASGPRTVVFDVSGIIDLDTNLVVTNDNITIAGQTAPGDGICLKGASFVVQASNVIVRYMRFRLGDNGYRDANGNIVGPNSPDSDTVGVYGSSGGTNNVIFDHCSMSWSIDEIIGMYGSTNAANGVNNVTFQYCIFSEALSSSHHSEGAHSMSFLINANVNNVTVYKNFFSNSNERHIRAGGGCSFEMINNVVYNFRYTCVISASNEFAVIGNHYKKGSLSTASSYLADYTSQTGFNETDTRAYVTGNTNNAGLSEIDPVFNPYLEPTPPISSGITAITASSATNEILANAGAILPARDAVDQRIINQYNTNVSSTINTQAQVGGYPNYNSAPALTDSDNDGMPNSWETQNGLNPNDPSDRNVLQPDGYTNLEYYLNGLSLQSSTPVYAGSDVTICNEDSTTLSASGSINYSWNTGATTSSITVSPSVTTTYTVSGTDSDGNTTSDQVVVFVTPLPIANAGNNVTICEGESTTLTASGGGTYQWSTGQNSQSVTVSPNQTTTYTVTVNSNGCQDTDQVIVNVIPKPNANAGNNVTINFGESTTLTASGGGTYLWSTGETTQSITVSPLVDTSYNVTVTQNGCEDTDFVTVFVNLSVTADAGENVTICEGESTTLTATGGDTYLWSTGETTQSITVSPNSSITYTVTATVNNVSDSDSVIVFVNPIPVADAGPDVSIVNGSSTVLTASGGNNYLWSTGETTQSITVSPTVTSNYTVTVNQNDCEDTDTIQVIVNEQVTAYAGPDINICEGESATLTASGGDTYLWSTGESTQSITVNPNSTSNYAVTVSIGPVSDTDSVTVFVNPVPNANAGPDVTITYGESTTLMATGGTSYLWSNGATTQSILVNPSQSTSYSVTVFQIGCEDTDTVIVTVNQNITADAGQDVSICEGESTILSASGGDTFLWSTGETTQSITVSPNSTTTYTVEVSSGPVSDTDDVIVTVNPQPIANAGSDISILNGESTTITASGGGTYFWSTGETTQSITVAPSQTTNYSVTVTVNGCVDSDTVLVIVNEPVTADAGPDLTICAGESIVLSASGGNAYQWDTGESSQSITVNPIVTTTYTVIAVIGNVSDSDEVTVFVNPMPNVYAGADISILNGENATLTATGGGSYLWSTGESTQSITISPSVTTTYSVTVDLNGCIASDDITVTVNEPVNADAGIDVTICEGESTMLTASGGDSYLWSTGETSQSIIVNPNITTSYSVSATIGPVSDTDSVVVYVNPLPVADAGPDVNIGSGDSTVLTASGGSSYLWSTGETTQSITVSPLDDTTYTVVVNQNGCEAQDSVIVTVNNTVIADAGLDVTICEGVSTTLTASGGDSYIWSTGETTASITVNPLVTTTYSVTATIGNDSDSDDVIVNVTPIPPVNAGDDVTICTGDSVTLVATGAASYLWNTGATTQNITVSPTETTTYTVTVSDNGCQASDQVTVTVNDAPVANAGPNQNIPNGQSANLTATGGGTYLWSTGQTTQSITVTPDATTQYTVTVSNGSCSDSDTVLVAINGNLNAFAGDDISICEGESAELTVDGGNSWEWSTGETTETIIVSPLVTTTYSVTVWQGANFDTDEVTVFVNPTPDPNLGDDYSICEGESTVLTADQSDTYLWSTGETTQSITVSPTVATAYSVFVTKAGCESSDSILIDVTTGSVANAGNDLNICEGETAVLTASGGDEFLWSTGESTSSISVSPSTTTVYSVTVTSNGCESIDDVTVNVNAVPLADAGTDVELCSGESTILIANGGDTYLWSTGETTQSITVNPTVTTTYIVSVYQNGCLATDEIIVTVIEFPNVNAGDDIAICEGENVTLTASGGSNYLWNTGATSESITVSPSSTTAYSVTSDNNGCEATDEVIVTVNANPIADAGADQTITEGQSVTLTATGGDTYLWNTGETTPSITVTPDTTTSYSVTVNTNGCEASDSVLITVEGALTAYAGEDVTICEGESTVLTVTGGSTQSWSTGETTQSIVVSPNITTTYSVIVYEGQNSSTDEVTVNVQALPEPNAGENITICIGNSTTLSATGGDSYMWSTGESTASITVTPSETTVYTVIASQNGCQASDAVTVTINENLDLDLGNDISMCEGESRILMAPLSDSYLWSTGETTQSIVVAPSSTTTYTLDITSNGCSASDSITLQVSAFPNADAGPSVSICEGESAVLTATGSGTYLWNTGETTQNITVSPTVSTAYSVTVTSNSCQSSDSVLVTVNEFPGVDLGPDSEICEGESVTLTTSASGSYLWSTGETTESITVNPNTTTTYSVTVSQGNCQTSDDILINVNPTVIADAGPNQNIPNGQSAILTATGGGTYLWSTGETTESITVSPTQTTHYTVTVSNGSCEDSDTVTVTVNGQLSAYAGEDVTICEGESTTLTVVGGNSQEWSTGETTENITVNPIVTTTYSVTVFQGNNSSTDEVTVFVDPIPSADAGEDMSVCEGEAVTLTASGGATYFWNTGATSQSITVSPTETTIYSVLVSQNNCEAYDEVTVSVNPPLVIDLGADMNVCQGETRLLTAPDADSYLWNTGEITQSINVTPNSTTTYSVNVESNGCEYFDSITINVNAFPSAYAGADVSICQGESTILSASGEGSFLWNTGETSQSITVTPTATSTYSVTVTQNDCQATDQVTVSVGEIGTVDAGPDMSICEGENITLSVTGTGDILWSSGQITNTITVNPLVTTTYSVTVGQGGCESTDEVTVTVYAAPEANAGNDVNISSGESTILTATGGGTYLWSTGETTQSIAVIPTSTTSYFVTVSQNGCEDTDSVVVIVDGEVMADAGEDVEICEGDSTVLSASGGNSYEWSTGETTASITVSPNSTTTYSVLVTTTTGSNTDEVTVFVNPLPQANAGNDMSVCSGETITLTATGGDSYLWNTGHTGATFDISPLVTTTYIVTVTSNGCSSTDEVTITVNNMPDAYAGEDDFIAQGQSTTLTATGQGNYLWNTGETTASIVVAPNDTTLYTVTVNNNGCIATDSILVTVEEGTINAYAGENRNICQGDSVILTASGGTDYLWSTGETTPSIEVSPNSTTVFSVIVSTGNLVGTDQVTVIVSDTPLLEVTGNIVIEPGEYTTLSANGANNYVWNNGATEPNIAVAPMITTTYQVTGYIEECTDSKDVTVHVLEAVSANAGEDITICSGNTITLTASGGGEYLWNTGETTQSITVSPMTSTTYAVIVSNAINSDSDDVQVFVDDFCDDTVEIPQDLPDFNYRIYSSGPNSSLYYAMIVGLRAPATLSIQDIQGKLVYEQKIDHNVGLRQDIPIQTRLFSDGVYIIKLQEQDKATTRKVLFHQN